MSDKSDFDMIIEFAEKKKKEGKEEGVKDKQKNREKFWNRLKLGVMFAILSLPVGLTVAILYLKLIHILGNQLLFR